MTLPLSSFVFPEETEGPFNLETLRPKIIQLIISASHARISGLPTVALGRGSSGLLYAGVNVELPDLPLHHTIHAEQFLVANLSLHEESNLNCLAISFNGSYFHPPCGHCCQFLQEIRNASDTQVLITDFTGQEPTYMRLTTFHPQGFPPYNVVPLNFPRLLEPGNNMLTLVDKNLARFIKDNSDPVANLILSALTAANRSYAPYSKCPSGVALLDRNAKVYSGWYIESEAHNPSLGPVQAALVDFIMANNGGHEFGKIVQAVLVEKSNSVVSQEATARMILGKIAHQDCVFRILYCS